MVAVRPGYEYPSSGEPVPGRRRGGQAGHGAGRRPADLAVKFGVPFSVTDATVEEQVAAIQREEGPVSFGVPAEATRLAPGERC